DSREVAGLVVHQGVVDRREIVVPVGKVAAVGDEGRLAVRSAELAGPPPCLGGGAPGAAQRPGGRQRGAHAGGSFLVGGGGWTGPVLLLERTAAAVAGTPAYVQDRDTVADPAEPDIAQGMHVYSSDGHRVGDVEAVEVDETSKRITRVIVRRGFLFERETSIPASMIASVSDRITLR